MKSEERSHLRHYKRRLFAVGVSCVALIGINQSHAGPSDCASTQLTSLLQRRMAGAPRTVGQLGTRLGRSDRFVFYTRTGGRQPLNAETLVPGRTYTTLERNGKMVIGDDFASESGSTAGTHPELGRTIAPEMPGRPLPNWAPYRGGSIRVNADGSVDVSGYHLQGGSPQACEEAAQELTNAFREAGVRVRVSTPDRLPPPMEP